MALELRIGLLADYAAFGQRGKLTIVHVFNQWTAIPERVGKPVGVGVLVARVEGSLVDGTEHKLTIQLIDADEKPQGPAIEIEPLTLAPSGPGLPLSAALLIDISGYPMPEPGDYRFAFTVGDGSNPAFGFVPVYVVPPTPSASA